MPQGIEQKGPASITAHPAEVRVGTVVGSTRINWDTGDGSIGEVRVVTEDSKELLVGKGPRGSSNVRWIRSGKRYEFRLYGGESHRALLGTVVVVGVRGQPSPGLAAPPDQLAPDEATKKAADRFSPGTRWTLRALGLALIIVCLYYGAPGKANVPVAKSMPVIRKGKVLQGVAGGIVIFFALDAAIFHSGLYQRILLPNSYPGSVLIIAEAEKQRPRSHAKEVALVGDSRVAEGFSAKVADERSAGKGIKFIDLSILGSSPRVWHYLLREVDPAANRYDAIVIPIDYEDRNRRYFHDATLDITMAAPLLRYGDAFEFAGSFDRWSNRYRAFATCLLRGYGFRSDVSDLLQHPSERMRSLRNKNVRLKALYNYAGQDKNLLGLSYNRENKQLIIPEQLSAREKRWLEESLRGLTKSQLLSALAYWERWIGQIQQRYNASRTAIVFIPLPRGPLGGPLAEDSGIEGSSLRESIRKRGALLLDRKMFQFLESPQYYFDAYHLNAIGRQKFTEKLTDELLVRLSPGTADTSLAPPTR